ncbi:hypothetical protein BDR26DRAFT_861508 [Obelidium mucronatum]|nr:hypothetical protein BDR26DRAFT_861508 [Obelidium mucronatum]
MQITAVALFSLISSVLAHITIIEPTGNSAYQSPSTFRITWENGGFPDATPVTFELADASQGANKVTPVGVTLSSNATVGLLQTTATVPAGVASNPKYCVRAAIKGDTGFLYYFSPTFAIGTTAGSAPAAGGSSSNSSSTTAAATAIKTSSSSRFQAVGGAVVMALALLV